MKIPMWKNIRIRISTLSNILIQLLVFVIFALFLDFFMGDRMLGYAAPAALEFVKIQRGGFEWREKHPVFHHTLKANADVLDSWGGETYRLCTNNLGAKSACQAAEITDHIWDIAFIGDSFTEGIGLPYEKTFVGLISAALPEKRILNLGVTSYSPTIYLKKLEYLINAGVKFREVVVFVDISDIQDETQYYLNNGIVESPNKEKDSGFFQRAFWQFPILSYAYSAFKPKSGRRKYGMDPERSAWTYRKNLKSYGALGIDGAIEKALAMMSELHVLLTQQNIPLSVAVYP